MFRCCICGNVAEGAIIFGEFVCNECHYEATGERFRKPMTEALPRGVRITAPQKLGRKDIRKFQIKHRKRSQIRAEMLLMNARNRAERECVYGRN